ncbi:proline--tRNA ligase-like protein [Carex littledalei]|uniref:Proline--tRNA ligase-like protein n=1 Tax=Carex littledalei TaxID=544730 RepID=A0A833QUM9_9POAL|nr:proline--tRNA ligase-like protein [Carex littledalei]
MCMLLAEGAISVCCSNIVDVSSYAELKEAIAEGKWARGPWSASDAEELKVKKENKILHYYLIHKKPTLVQ